MNFSPVTILDDADVLRNLEYEIWHTDHFKTCQTLEGEDWGESRPNKIKNRLLDNIVCENNETPITTKFKITGESYSSVRIYTAGNKI